MQTYVFQLLHLSPSLFFHLYIYDVHSLSVGFSVSISLCSLSATLPYPISYPSNSNQALSRQNNGASIFIHRVLHQQLLEVINLTTCKTVQNQSNNFKINRHIQHSNSCKKVPNWFPKKNTTKRLFASENFSINALSPGAKLIKRENGAKPKNGQGKQFPLP